MSTTLPADSLVELAARKQLPHHQYTDPATVRWIAANRPELPDGPPPPILRPSSRQLVARAALPADWLAEARCHDSLHGIRHAVRTAAMAALLAEAIGLGEEETATLVLAAAVHDCRRLHDKDDTGHGARAAIWLTENAGDVWDRFGLTPTPSRVTAAGTAVRLHDLPYEHFSPDDRADHARTRTITDLLKAADAWTATACPSSPGGPTRPASGPRRSPTCAPPPSSSSSGPSPRGWLGPTARKPSSAAWRAWS